MKDNLEQIYQRAVSRAGSLQTWPGHFLAKRTETEILRNNCDMEGCLERTCLEIGCGNAFQASLLSGFFRRVIATDLFSEDSNSHTVGMYKARAMMGALNIKNISLVSCSSLSLPFCDGYFDFIFSSSALEHLQDKSAALKEMRRVLKDGGQMVTIVPTHIPSLLAFIHVYLYCLARLVEKNGFKVKDSFAVCLVPWLLIEPFSTSLAARIYGLTKGANIKLSGFKILKYISYLVGIVAKKGI